MELALDFSQVHSFTVFFLPEEIPARFWSAMASTPQPSAGVIAARGLCLRR